MWEVTLTKIKIELLPEESRKVAQAAKQGRDTRGFEVALNRHRTPSAKPTARAPHSYTPISKQRVTRTASISPRYYIQAGAFSQEQNAQRFSQLLSGIADTNVVSSLSSNGTLYKVRVGPVKNQAEANALLTAVESRSRSNAIIIKE